MIRGCPVIAGAAGSGQMITGDVFSNERLNAMKLNGTFFQLGAVALCLTAVDVNAQTARNCGPREAVVDRLADGYGETRQSMGLGANNSVIEVSASAETGTWTITMTSPNGMTCLVASGQAFEELAEVLPSKGNDA